MYLSFSETIIQDFSDESINNLYSQGYLFTRKAKGNLYQTRSLRIDLSKFELNSENRRVLNKNEQLTLNMETIPMVKYSWLIHQTGKEFYTKKFGDLTFSAAKIKELVSDGTRTNMNLLFSYSIMTNQNVSTNSNNYLSDQTNPVGYAICYHNSELLHYAYPFYNLNIPKEQSLGMGMMLKAIQFAKANNKKYIYLGSIVEPSSKYKLQFQGLEWWDNDIKAWSTDLEKVKELIAEKAPINENI